MTGFSIIFVAKTIVLWILFSIVFVPFGARISKLLLLETNPLSNLALGFLANLALVQSLGWAFVAFRWSNIIFRAFVLALLIAEFLWSYRDFSFSFKPLPKWILLVTVPLVTIAAITLILYRSDADDSFYVSNVTLFQSSNILNAYDSSFGDPELGTVPMYDFETWEAWIAVFAWLFRIDGASMMHTVLLPFLLAVSCGAYLFLGEILFSGNKIRAALFYCLLMICFLMDGYAVYSPGSFLLSRLWQGKAVYLHVILPLMTGFLLLSLRKRIRFHSLFLLSCILAGIALNPTSLYILGFQALAMTIGICFLEKAPRKLVGLLPSIGVIGFFTLAIYFRTRSFSGQIEAASQTGSSFVFEWFMRYWGSGFVIFLLYLAAAVFLWFRSNEMLRLYFIITPLILFLLVWNPLCGNFIAQTVTKTPSYWRVFWLIPASPALVCTVILIVARFHSRRWLSLFLGILVLVLPGKFMFTQENGFILSENVQKVPSEVLTFQQTLFANSSTPLVLGNYDFSTTLRQVYPQIQLVVSRDQYILDLFAYRGRQQEADERMLLIQFANGSDVDPAEALRILSRYGVDFVVLAQNNPYLNYLQANGWFPAQQSESHVLLTSAPA